MATYGTTVRRGLPRTRGGQPWPAAGDAPVEVAEPAVAECSAADPAVADSSVVDAAVAAASVAVAASTPAEAAPAVPAPAAAEQVAAAAPVAASVAVRRGLPRVKGGEPWPPAGAVPAAALAAASAVAPPQPAESAVSAAAIRQDAPVELQAIPVDAAAPSASPAAATWAAAVASGRRGVPRVKGGQPWPPERFVTMVTTIAEPVTAAAATVAASTPVETAAPAKPAVAAPVSLAERIAEPLQFPPTVHPGAAAVRWNADRARRTPIAAVEPKRIGPFTRGQWVGAVTVGGAGLLFAAGMVVLFVRWLLSVPFMVDFLHTYPGQYALPVAAPVGFPLWLQWQHFFNVLFMVLIIRTGLTVRREKRPAVFWSPASNPKRKISLTLWFHQALDILWIVNGVIFAVLLFTTGQWMRIIPTSSVVVPNAVSAALQYASLHWPTEDGWVNYNALQQLAYFSIVFLAAPLAAVTGVRMSGVWPKNAKRLSRAYPVEWARAVHFPVMIYFVLFIIVHVSLVFATGALRNLNHMYGNSDKVNWTGFWIFVASLVVIAAAWIAARPLTLAPIARLFGKVSGR